MKYFLLYFVILGSGLATGQVKGKNLAILMPWEILGYDYERKLVLRNSLQELSEKLAEQYLIDPKPFSQLVDQTVSLNAKKRAQAFIAGQSKLPSNHGLFIQPSICRVKDEAILSVQVGSLKEGFIAAMKVHSFPIEQLGGEIKEEKLDESSKALLIEKIPKKLSPLKLRLTLKRSSNNSLKGANHCPNLLLASGLSQRFRIQQFVGSQSTVFARKHLEDIRELAMTRANRAIHVDWLIQKDNLIAYAELSEGVFGHEIYQGQAWPMSAPYGTNIQIPPRVQQLLELEERSLDLRTAPRVASIYGAWAYLDKGRAWGLKVNDRVYIQTAEKKVKAHVIGY